MVGDPPSATILLPRFFACRCDSLLDAPKNGANCCRSCPATRHCCWRYWIVAAYSSDSARFNLLINSWPLPLRPLRERLRFFFFSSFLIFPILASSDNPWDRDMNGT